MQSSCDESIRLAWTTTQENLETAVGTAYSGWTRFNAGYVRPVLESVRGCFASCLGRTGRRGSFSQDFFFDMYDDDEAFGRDELERLLNEDRPEYTDDPVDLLEEGPSSHLAARLGKNDSPLGERLGLKDSGTLTAKMRSWIPFWSRSDPMLWYKPSTAGLTGVRTRTRSSTKSSTRSSETFRSRGDLFSDGEYDGAQMEDAQMVSDNFAASLVFGNEHRTNSSSTNISSIDDYPVGASEEELRQGEQEVDRKRTMAVEKVAKLVLGNSKSGQHEQVSEPHDEQASELHDEDMSEEQQQQQDASEQHDNVSPNRRATEEDFDGFQQYQETATSIHRTGPESVRDEDDVDEVPSSL